MKSTQFYRPVSGLFGTLLVVLAFGIGGWPQDAEAHKGHAGSMVTFIKKKAALKHMLPAGARIVRRKQPLKEKAADWAEKTYGVALDEKFYSYYLATNRESKAIVGAAYVSKKTYRHGDIKFAVGVDSEGRITQAAILGVNEKYVVDFDGNVGTGLIADYAGLTPNEVIAKADELSSADKPTRDFAAAVRDAAILLSAFIHGN